MSSLRGGHLGLYAGAEAWDYFGWTLYFMIFLIVLEAIYSYVMELDYYALNDTIVSMSHGVLSDFVVQRIFIPNLELLVQCWIYYHYAIYRLKPSWWLHVITFFGIDFCYYWLHRAAHEVNFIWATHQVHHSSERYNLSTATRQGVFQQFVAWLAYVPMAFFIPPTAFMVHRQINTFYQFWIHTRTVGSMGTVLEFILNTPSHHRVHHARNPRYLDKNYGGLLIIWDRMFGTFEPETETVAYGLVHPDNFYDVMQAQFGHFYNIIHSYTTKHDSIADKLKAVFYGPGWVPGSPRLGFPIPTEGDEGEAAALDMDMDANMNVDLDLNGGEGVARRRGGRDGAGQGSKSPRSQQNSKSSKSSSSSNKSSAASSSSSKSSSKSSTAMSALSRLWFPFSSRGSSSPRPQSPSSLPGNPPDGNNESSPAPIFNPIISSALRRYVLAHAIITFGLIFITSSALVPKSNLEFSLAIFNIFSLFQISRIFQDGYAAFLPFEAFRILLYIAIEASCLTHDVMMERTHGFWWSAGYDLALFSIADHCFLIIVFLVYFFSLWFILYYWDEIWNECSHTRGPPPKLSIRGLLPLSPKASKKARSPRNHHLPQEEEGVATGDLHLPLIGLAADLHPHALPRNLARNSASRPTSPRTNASNNAAPSPRTTANGVSSRPSSPRNAPATTTATAATLNNATTQSSKTPRGAVKATTAAADSEEPVAKRTNGTTAKAGSSKAANGFHITTTAAKQSGGPKSPKGRR